MIIYIIGYGRSGSTALSRLLEKKLNAINLGEVKYLYYKDKDDLLDNYWLNFKEDNKDLIEKNLKQLKQFDNLFGLFKLNALNDYKDVWDEIFNRTEIDPEQDIVIDSSKTTLDSFMRGFNLKKCYKDVLFVKPKRNLFGIVGSMLKGKNSNIERKNKKSNISRLFHTTFVGLPHLFITQLLSWFYRGPNLQTIRVNDMEAEVENFIQSNGLKKSKLTSDIPMVYGNRNRKNKQKHR